MAAVTPCQSHEEDSVIQIAGDDYSNTIDGKVYSIFDKNIIQFIVDWAEMCQSLTKIDEYRDVSALLFWCRRRNLNQLREQYRSDSLIVGRGLVFQIAPANVHLNAFYTLFFALISGNPTIVRVSRKTNEAMKPFFRYLSEAYELHRDLIPPFTVLSYPHDSVMNALFSQKCACRVIWGSDQTVAQIRSFKSQVDCLDICFPNRVSSLIVDEDRLACATETEIETYARGLARDVGLYGQQTCSSPLFMIIVQRYANIKASATMRLLEMVDRELCNNYDREITPREHFISSVEAASRDKILTMDFKGKKLSTINIGNRKPDELIREWKPSSGVLYVSYVNSYSTLKLWAGHQTSVLIPYNEEMLRDYERQVESQHYRRVVQSGRAIGMNMHWDGHDIVRLLSRSIHRSKYL